MLSDTNLQHTSPQHDVKLLESAGVPWYFSRGHEFDSRCGRRAVINPYAGDGQELLSALMCAYYPQLVRTEEDVDPYRTYLQGLNNALRHRAIMDMGWRGQFTVLGGVLIGFELDSSWVESRAVAVAVVTAPGKAVVADGGGVGGEEVVDVHTDDGAESAEEMAE